MIIKPPNYLDKLHNQLEEINKAISEREYQFSNLEEHFQPNGSLDEFYKMRSDDLHIEQIDLYAARDSLEKKIDEETTFYIKIHIAKKLLEVLPLTIDSTFDMSTEKKGNIRFTFHRDLIDSELKDINNLADELELGVVWISANEVHFCNFKINNHENKT
ncbi:MAG: hypothetical protein KAX05_15535 [Bacteroidales bacterium]|nr:hypothetical protein [Bacteroidales bacterium]